MYENILKLEEMRYMSIDKIVELYKDGYILEEPLLNALQQGCDCRNTALFYAFFGFGIGILYSRYRQ